ncbi:MAG TPA: ABC transporter substrate-binding protein [Trueperaceae bacterium]
MPKTFARLLLSLLLPTILLLSAASAAPSQEPFKVGYVRVMDDAQVILAYEAGLYAQYGLDAELVEFASGTDLIKAIVGGQLDLGVLGFSNAFTWVSRGADLKIVGGAQMGYHAILARKDSGIHTVADLAGHTLASQKEGSTADIVLKGVTLADAGLSPKDLNILGVAPAVAVQSLVSGRVDAAFLFEPYDRIARLVAPVEKIYQIGEVWPFPCMVAITSSKTLEARPDAIHAALDAQADAIDMLETNPRKAAGYIAGYFIAEPTLDTLEQGAVPREDVITQAIKTQAFSPYLTDENIARMKELEAIMKDQGVLQSDIDVDAILDLSWQRARQSQAAR